MTCTFFGHRDAPNEIEPILISVLEELITNEHVELFYVGNQGRFDNMVRKSLKQLKEKYSFIRYWVVLAYMPGKKDAFCEEDDDTIYPEGLETTPPKYAISKRNRWMIEQSDYVITFVEYSQGGAGQFQEIAQRKGKRVIKLTDMMPK